MSAAAQVATALVTPASEARLRVYLLGPPRVDWAGESFAIRRRQVRALLFCLAADFETLDRDRLCFLFWPDTPDRDARRNLTHLLSHLRRALPDPDVLMTAEDQVRLDCSQVWSDAAVFERRCSSLRPATAPNRRRPAGDGAGIRILEGVVDLYQGPFLSGFSLSDSPEYEAWADQERRSLQQHYLETLMSLVEAMGSRGAYDVAIAYAQRYLAVDDLAEEVHRRLIELYALAGERSAALHQFELCTTIMERELGVSPLPQTRAAYEAALRGGAGVRQALPAPSWTTLPSLDAPLVGRDEALAQMDQAYQPVRSGTGRVLLICGEPGIGKTRLVQDYMAGLGDEATLMCGSGHEGQQGLPFCPVLEALRPYLPALDWAGLGVDTAYLAEVARLLPELRSQLPDLPPVFLDPDHEQTGLFEALARLFLGLAEQRSPLILCLDDLQWADRTTLSWLAFFVRYLDRAPILVVGVCRTEDAAMLTDLRSCLSRLGLLHEVALGGLAVADVLCLIQHLSCRTGGAQLFSLRLHRETGGNPFFLLETLRAMFEAGILRQDDTGWSTGVNQVTGDYAELPLPYTVSQAIEHRLRRLSPETYQVLEAGAVLGHVFGSDQVHRTSGRQEDQVVDALDALVARHLLIELGGRYRFAHDLIRAVVYRDLGPARRRLLHRRAGGTLESMGSTDLAALVRHFGRAGKRGQAAQYALQAGRAARALFAYDEARACFDQALTFLEREARLLREQEARTANRRLRLEALDGRGWALRLMGDMEAYARDLAEVARLAGLLADQRTLAHLRWREATSHRWFCRYEEALQAAESGCDLAQKASDSLVEGMCWREVGLTARATGDYAQARLALERALGFFVQEGATTYEIHTLGNLSTLCWYRGEYQEALALSRRALARCDAAGLVFERRLPLGDMGAAAAALGDAVLARRSLRESQVIAHQIEDRTQEIFCLGHLGWHHIQQAQPAEALKELRQALDLAEVIDSLSEQSWLLAGLAKAHYLAGDASRAAACARQALHLAREQGRAFDQEQAAHVLAELK